MNTSLKYVPSPVSDSLDQPYKDPTLTDKQDDDKVCVACGGDHYQSDCPWNKVTRN